MISIDGSTGTDVKSASTSNDIIASSGFSWVPSILCKKSWLFWTWCDESGKSLSNSKKYCSVLEKIFKINDVKQNEKHPFI